MKSFWLATCDLFRAPTSRLRGFVTILLAVVCFPVTGFEQESSEQVTVIWSRGRSAVPISLFAGVPMVPLDEIAPFFDGFIRTETDSAVISAGGGAARLSSGRSLVRVEDKLVLLSAPVRAGGSRWFVPLDFLEKVVPALSEEKASYRGDDRILVIGEGFPRLSVRASAHPAYTRIVLESSTTIPYQVNHVGPQVQVSIQAEYLETDFQTQELRDGVVERMSLAHRAGSYVFVLELGERFGTLKAFEMNNPDRIVLDLCDLGSERRKFCF